MLEVGPEEYGGSENEPFTVRELPFSRNCNFYNWSSRFLIRKWKDRQMWSQQELFMTEEAKPGWHGWKSPYWSPEFWAVSKLPIALWLSWRASLHSWEIVNIPHHSVLSNTPCRLPLFLLSTVNGSNLFLVSRDPIWQGGDKEPHLIIQSATAFLQYL